MREGIGQRLRTLRNEMGMRQQEIADAAGISQSALSAIENGDNTPTIDTLSAIAAALGVQLADLFVDKCCPVCGFEYTYDEGLSSAAHQAMHIKAQAIIDLYGFYWPYRVRKIEVKKAYAILENHKSSPDARYDAAVKLMRCFFCRSVSAYDGPDHPGFDKYAAMILGSREHASELPEDIYSRLVEKYGSAPGISSGTYYQRPEAKSSDPRIDKICAKLKHLPEKYVDVIELICDHATTE